MPFQLPPNDEVLTAGAFNDQVSDTTPVLPATRPHTWTQVRTAHPCRTNASAGMSDAVRSQDQVHSDFMKSREAYLQSEATTKDWTHKRTKQRYSRKKAEPSTKAAPNNSKTCGPNPYEVGSKEWLEEFDRRMGIKGLPLPDRPKDQEVRGETYHEWHARYGGKTEWDPMAFLHGGTGSCGPFRLGIGVEWGRGRKPFPGGRHVFHQSMVGTPRYW